MKAYRMRSVVGVVIMLLLLPLSVLAAPLNQPATFKEINGSPLRVEVGSNGSIQVYHERTGDVGAAYGTADSGFFLAIGNDVYGPNLPNTNPSSASFATNSLSLVSHDGPTGSGSAADPFKIVTNQTLDGSGANLSVVQTVSYINGNDYFRQDWGITNNGSSEVCFNAYHAADIYFAGSDSGVGYYNAESGAVGGKGQDNDGNDWFMVFSPVTPADHYQEGDYAGEIWNTVETAGNLNDSIETADVDNGIALQWNKCIQPGETTTISDLWSFGENEETVIPPTPMPTTPTPTAVPPTPTPSPTPTLEDPDADNSHGDVHIFTPDGLIFDFQATGDFIATQSDDGKVIVQARQETSPVNATVSLNTALALWVDGDKVEFYVKSEPRFYVNDEAQDTLPASGYELANGGNIDALSVSDSRAEFLITWPDGSFKARVIMYLNSHMDYGVARLGDTQSHGGILGSLDGNAQNDLQLRDGNQIKPPPSVDELNRFGDSWRVPADESLFHSEDAADQTELTEQPHAVVTIAEEDRAEAEEICQNGGVSDALALRNCTYDVAVTDDPIFIESAKMFEEATKDLPPSAKVPATAGETLGGAIFDANMADAAGITILDGDDLVMTTGKAADGSGYLRFNIYRNGEYVASFSVGTDGDVAGAVAASMVPAPAEEVIDEGSPEGVEPATANTDGQAEPDPVRCLEGLAILQGELFVPDEAAQWLDFYAEIAQEFLIGCEGLDDRFAEAAAGTDFAMLEMELQEELGDWPVGSLGGGLTYLNNLVSEHCPASEEIACTDIMEVYNAYLELSIEVLDSLR